MDVLLESDPMISWRYHIVKINESIENISHYNWDIFLKYKNWTKDEIKNLEVCIIFNDVVLKFYIEVVDTQGSRHTKWIQETFCYFC